MTNVIYPVPQLKPAIIKFKEDFLPDAEDFGQLIIDLLSNKEVISYLRKIFKKDSLVTKQSIVNLVEERFPEWTIYIMKKYGKIKDYNDKEREKAIDIIMTKDPLHYCLEVLKKQHIGEEHILLLGMISAISTGMQDRKMLIHIMGVGASGKGKTDSLECVGKIFSNYEPVISASPKNIFYKAANETLVDNGILFFPENDTKDIEFQALERVLTDDKDMVPKHETVINQKAVSLDIKQINVMWRNSVGTTDDEDNQLNNRYYIFNVDESLQQDKLVYDHILDNWNINQTNIDEELHICKAITDYIKSDKAKVIIPFIRGIELSYKADRRTIKKFLRLVSVITYFYRFERVKANDLILSDLKDFQIANIIWNQINKYESSKLPEYETGIIEEVSKHDGISVTDLSKILDKDISNLNKKITIMEERGLIYSEKIAETTTDQYGKRITKPRKMVKSTKTPSKIFGFGTCENLIDLAIEDLRRLNIEELEIPEKRFGSFGTSLGMREVPKLKKLFKMMFSMKSLSHFENNNHNINNNIYNNIYIYNIIGKEAEIWFFPLLPNQVPLPYQNPTKTDQNDIEVIEMEDLI